MDILKQFSKCCFDNSHTEFRIIKLQKWLVTLKHVSLTICRRPARVFSVVLVRVLKKMDTRRGLFERYNSVSRVKGRL